MKLMNEAFADQYAALGEFKGWTAPGLQFSSMFFVFILIMILLDIFVRKTQFGYKLRLSAATGMRHCWRVSM